MNYPIIIFKLVHFQSYQFNLSYSSPYSYSKITEWTSNPEHINEALDNVERTVHCENNFRLSVLFSFLFASLHYLFEIIINNLVLFILYIMFFYISESRRHDRHCNLATTYSALFSATGGRTVLSSGTRRQCVSDAFHWLPINYFLRL